MVLPEVIQHLRVDCDKVFRQRVHRPEPDLGAFSAMLWCFEQREKIYDILEAVCGARLTTSYTRIGGLFRDVPDDFSAMVEKLLEEFPGLIDELETMLVGNRIFEDRLHGIGVITRQEAIDWGLTGPIARGDIGTISKHLEALKTTAPHLLSTYRELGRQTIPIAQAKGKINQSQARELQTILERPD